MRINEESKVVAIHVGKELVAYITLNDCRIENISVSDKAEVYIDGVKAGKEGKYVKY